MSAFLLVLSMSSFAGLIVITIFFLKSLMTFIVWIVLKLEHRRSQRRFDRMRPRK